MGKFKKGDRVRVIKGNTIIKDGWVGVVLETNSAPFVEFQFPFPSGHNALGRGKDGYCFTCFPGEIELVEDKPKCRFKKGDRVCSRSRGYTGTVISDEHQTRIKGELIIRVRRDGKGASDSWACQVLSDGNVADAWGAWDEESLLEPEERQSLCDGIYHHSLGVDWARHTKVFDAHFKEEDIKPKKPFMTQVNTMMKKLLDADTQALIKAGFLDGELDVTDKAQRELWAILFQANKGALVELAKTELAEEKK
jgi:hypothetical protein